MIFLYSDKYLLLLSSFFVCARSFSGLTVTFSLLCETPSRYCVEYSDGSLHDVLTFELIVLLSAAFAVFGYLRASAIYQSETYDAIDGVEASATATASDNLLQNGSNEEDDV